MNVANVVRVASVALCVAAALIFGSDALAKTTDESDLWWVPSESGWGIQLVEEENTIFATMFVYGPDGKPTWYSATMTHVASLTWAGDLYTTTGPWFGTVQFDPTMVVRSKVGTMSLNAPLISQATLTYTVNSEQVVKQIQRQTLVTLNFNGAYIGTLSQQDNGLPSCNSSRNTAGTQATLQITQNGAAMTIVAQTNADTCTFSGAYSQRGHFGQNTGTYTCTSGDSGTFLIFEMAVSFYDFRARTQLNSQTGCTLKGYMQGLTQPPPPQ